MVPTFDNLILIQRLKNQNIDYNFLLHNKSNNITDKEIFYLKENKNIQNISCPSSLFDNNILHHAITDGPELSHLSLHLTLNQGVKKLPL